MTVATPPLAPGRMLAAFPEASLAAVREAYPERSITLRHKLSEHPLLGLEALAQLGETLPGASVEYNRGDLPTGLIGPAPGNGMGIGETIRGIAGANSWAVLKNIEQSPPHRDLLMALLSELEPVVTPRTGPMLTPQGYVFISSPGSMTPFHFDPEHNILMQLVGEKVMTVFPAGDPRFASPEAHEAYHLGNSRNLAWQEDFAPHGTACRLAPGDAILVPVMAPHFVRNGPAPSISLSITWRSHWSYEEADARGFNGRLRAMGLTPGETRRWPGRNRWRALGGRLWRRLAG